MELLKKLSIRAVLGLVIGITGLLLVVVSTSELTDAAKAWRNAGRLAVRTTISRSLFNMYLPFRLERGTEIATVISDAPANSGALTRIAENRKLSEQAYAESLKLLASASIDGLSATVDRLTAAHAAMDDIRRRIDSENLKPKSDRDAKLIQEVPTAADKYLDAMVAIADLLDASLKMVDPAVDQLLSVKRAAWGARNSGGMVAIRIESAAAAGKTWSSADVAVANADAGRTSYCWTLINEAAIRSDAPPALVEAAGKAKQYFVGPMADERKSLMDTLTKGEQITMPLADLQKRNTVELNLIVDLLNVALDEMIGRARSQTEHALWSFAFSGLQLVVALAFTAIGLVIAYRRVSLPLVRMSEAMRRLAAHDLGAEIPGIGRLDEIGAMAEAMQVFKDNAAKADQLAAESQRAQEARDARTRVIEGLTQDFDGTVSTMLGTVSGALANLNERAAAMSATSEQTSRQAVTVAAASEQASAGVQTVASAADELSASITEIGRQVSQSSDVSRVASDEASQTNEIVKSLAESAVKIGDVVRLINDIASQTNLLALNATIEAARAGDAGKGFAVVAGEVKSLANQTAKATDEISAQISAVQVSTEQAVQAIGTIVTRIGEINSIAGAIAAAVEEQSAATAEIARNVQQTASGTQSIASNIGGVTKATDETGASARELVSSAQLLSKDTAQLKEMVGQFLEKVRTA